MSRRPFPPADFPQRAPVTEVIDAGTTIFRFYKNGYGSTYFAMDRGGRLNAPDASYGVLYAAQSVNGAFAETFLRDPGHNRVDGSMLHSKGLVHLRATVDLRLASLFGPGLANIGATAEVTHSGVGEYDLSQDWSRALYDHPADFDGIAYRSRHDDNEICYAIFDRAQRKIQVADEYPDLDRDEIWELIDRYGFRYYP